MTPAGAHPDGTDQSVSDLVHGSARLTAVTHVAIRVRSLELSTAFYRDVLGFQIHNAFDTRGGPTARLLGRPENRVRGVFMSRDGMTVELQQTDGVTEHSDAVLVGLSHLGFQVTVFDAAIAAIVAAGGTLLEETVCTTGGLRFAFATDPDGTRLELIELPPGTKLLDVFSSAGAQASV